MATPLSLGDSERAAVSAAVSAAEQATAGEIVTIIAERSDEYRDVALLWSALGAFLSLLILSLEADAHLALADRITGEWQNAWTPAQVFGLAATVATLVFFALWLAQRWQWLKFRLVPAPIRHGRVRARAITCFKVGAERRTHGRTGILIYLSLREHRAEIVADEAIAGKVPPEIWGEAMAAMIDQAREGRIGEGMVAAVEQVGKVLAEHFPRAEHDINELPDRLIEV